MDTFRRLFEKPASASLHSALQECGDVISVLMKGTASTKPYFEGADFPLEELSQTSEFEVALSKLGQVCASRRAASALDRLEFEGSLTSVLVQGGCHGQGSLPKQEGRHLVENGVAALFPEPFDELLVLRMDDPEWSVLTSQATISKSYFCWQGARGLWWFLCVTDFD